MSEKRLDGRVALVTGASRGLGFAAAKAVSYTHLTLPTILRV